MITPEDFEGGQRNEIVIITETSKKNTKNLRSGGLRRNGDKKI